jgi:hypothetical protein
MKQLIDIRDHKKDDEPFLFSTYLKNNWYDKTNSTTLKKATWMNLQHGRLEKVLDKQKIKIACLKEDPDVILGYSFQDGSAPFVYVKLAWRNNQLNIKDLLLKSLEEK